MKAKPHQQKSIPQDDPKPPVVSHRITAEEFEANRPNLKEIGSYTTGDNIAEDHVTVYQGKDGAVFVFAVTEGYHYGPFVKFRYEKYASISEAGIHMSQIRPTGKKHK